MRILTTLSAVEAVKIEYSKSTDMGYRLQVLLNVVANSEQRTARGVRRRVHAIGASDPTGDRT